MSNSNCQEGGYQMLFPATQWKHWVQEYITRWKHRFLLFFKPKVWQVHFDYVVIYLLLFVDLVKYDSSVSYSLSLPPNIKKIIYIVDVPCNIMIHWTVLDCNTSLQLFARARDGVISSWYTLLFISSFSTGSRNVFFNFQ